LIVGEGEGYLEVVDINTSTITSTHRFIEGDSIYDIIAIDDTDFLLGALSGLLKTTKDQVINHYYKWEYVTCLCHITDSLYLVGLDKKLIVWHEEKEQEMYKICDAQVDSIKRVKNTDNFILKTFS
jgi:hypothetical protein